MTSDDEKRIAEIVDSLTGRNPIKLESDGPRAATEKELIDELCSWVGRQPAKVIRWMENKLAERDARIAMFNNEIAGYARVLDEKDDRIAKLEAVLREFASYKHSSMIEEIPWLAEEALK